MEVKRRPFQGVLNILSFNRHFYYIGIVGFVLLLGSRWVLAWPPILFGIAIFALIYGLVMPLLVSAYVYDFSGFYRFDWLKNVAYKDASHKLIVNINAGFDETSFSIHQLFPKSTLRVFDFYNAEQHTEAAIIRARKVSMTYPDTQQTATTALPIENQSVDLFLLLSAAHEIRDFDERVHFLSACHRALGPNGQLIMVEHLRDLPNFLAFTVGFTHFFSRKAWLIAFKKAGFQNVKETKFTPFMSIFNCQP